MYLECSYFKRTGISTNNDVRRCYVYHAPCTYVRARVCMYLVFIFILTVGKHLSTIVLIHTHIDKSKLNLSHATANYQKREFTHNKRRQFLFMTLKMLYISATQTQCNQSINQSINLKKMGLEVLRWANCCIRIECVAN